MKALILLSVAGGLALAGCAQGPAPAETADASAVICRSAGTPAAQCMTRAQWQNHDREIQEMSAAARMGLSARDAALSYGAPMQTLGPNAPMQ